MDAFPEGQAKTLKEAFQLCDVGPLEIEEAIARYYVDLSAVRSNVAMHRPAGPMTALLSLSQMSPLVYQLCCSWMGL